MRILPVYFDDEDVDLSAFPPGAELTITRPDGTGAVVGGKALADSFRIISPEVPVHEHPVTGIALSPQPPVDG